MSAGAANQLSWTSVHVLLSQGLPKPCVPVVCSMAWYLEGYLQSLG